MPFYTPLRYPGGKRRLAPVVSQLLVQNDMRDIDYVEPYAGGAAVALDLLFSEHAATVHINDLARPVYAFWHSVLNRTDEFCAKVSSVRVSMAEWHRQQAVYQAREMADIFDLGFAAFFLNRTNRSGIIGGGVIGGQKQTGNWTVAARFNKPELIQRIKRIGRYRSRINLYQQDALEFTLNVVPNLGGNTFAFYDPPYVEKSEDLYLNTYDLDGHKALAQAVTDSGIPWVVTYDHAAVTAGLFKNQRRLAYDLSYSAQERYEGREVMFMSDGLILPPTWLTSKPFLLSKERSKHPVYGKMQNMKTAPASAELEEGPEAFERFRKAVKAVIAVPKDTLPAKPSRAKKKAAKRKT